MFSGRTEAFLTSTKRAQTISDLLLWEIPQFVIPNSLQSDNGTKFTSQISQTLPKVLNIPWHFHVPYHTQSLRKIEWTNCSSKIILVKMLQELYLASDSFQALNYLQVTLFNLTLWTHMGNCFYLLISHLNPYLSLITNSPHYLNTSISSYGTLLTAPYFDPCPSSINILVQVLLSPPDQSLSLLSPKGQGPFKIII